MGIARLARRWHVWLPASLALAISAGHLGMLHPALDSFSHLRPQLIGLAFATSVALLIGRRWLEALALAALALASSVPTLRWYEPETVEVDGEALVILQQNLLYRNDDAAAFLERVREVQPDVIALQEVERAGRAMASALAAEYPYRHTCRGASAVGDVMIVARLPIVGGRSCTPGLAVARFRVGRTPFTVASLHLHWPWPAPQNRHIESLRAVLGAIEAPAIMVGDYNAVPWSYAMRRLERMMKGKAVPGIGNTRIDLDWPAALRPFWDLPIDHVVTTEGLVVRSVEAIPLRGSDHDSVVTRATVLAAPVEQEARLSRRAGPRG